MIQRIISTVRNNPSQEGFLGAGHSAAAVLGGIPYEQSDPFIVFQDDAIDFTGGDPVGGAHPHAGFETLTLVLKGNEKEWDTGSFEIMTAGKGIIHTEESTAAAKLRFLQVWLVLSPEKRWTEPFWQKIQRKDTPTIKNEGYEIHVYSGSSNGLTSPLQNATPLTVVDFKIMKDHKVKQELPANYVGLIYVLEGTVRVGKDTIAAQQSGWLNAVVEFGESEITFYSLENHTRFILYAAQPHNVPIVAQGPFIGDNKEDIIRLHKEYRNGEMPHLDDLPKTQRIEVNNLN